MTIYRGQGGLGDSYNDPELVHTSGDETIEGVKTFTSTIIGTISGHYTKAEEDTKLALKANQSTTYTKTEVDTLITAKADQSTTYTKTEVDTALTGKLSTANGSVGTNNLANNAVTYAKMQNVTAGKVLGRDTSGTGVPQELPIAVDSSGNLLVGTTSNALGTDYGKFVVKRDTTGWAQVASSATDGTYSYLFKCVYNNTTSTGGIYTTATTVSYGTSSDYRLKENIQPMQNALDVVSQLNPVTYTWKINGTSGQGFIAHELQAVVPDCVVGEKDAVDADGNPVYQGIDTSFLVATLTAAIQEQQAMIEQLKADVAALKGAA